MTKPLRDRKVTNMNTHAIPEVSTASSTRFDHPTQGSKMETRTRPLYQQWTPDLGFIDDAPDYDTREQIGTITEYGRTENGKFILHRDDHPAEIVTDNDGRPLSVSYWQDGKMHAEGHPARIVIDADTGKPLVIEWRKNGRLHRINAPAKLIFEPGTGEISAAIWAENGTEFEFHLNLPWAPHTSRTIIDGKEQLHSYIDQPSLIGYTEDGYRVTVWADRGKITRSGGAAVEVRSPVIGSTNPDGLGDIVCEIFTNEDAAVMVDARGHKTNLERIDTPDLLTCTVPWWEIRGLEWLGFRGIG